MEKLYYADIGRIDAQIQIAGVSVTRPIMKIGPTTELIGTQVMRRFSWTFDQRSRRVRIRPDSPDPLRLPSKRGTGAVLFPADEGYEIARGLEETPAARAGLRAGDIVVAANAVRVYEQSCDRWNEEYETETTLTVLRDGETFDLVVEIVDLVP
jgi:predicted metalloprotease with PDZ domain